MQSPYNYIQQNRTFIFDWLVFVTTMTMGFVFPSLGTFVASIDFSMWMLVALVVYTIGTWLKRVPLYLRNDMSGHPLRKISWLLFLVIGHWIILYMVTLFAVPAWCRIFHYPMPKGFDSISTKATALSMIPPTIITWIVYRRARLRKKLSTYAPNIMFYRELVADIMLISSISLFTFTFWEKGAMAMMSRKALTSISEILFMIFFLGICYVLFYLPLRYLYLVEDHTSNQTRKRLTLILALLVIRSLLFNLS